MPIAALDNEDSALAHRDERAVFGDFVGDGVLRGACEGGVFEGILAALQLHTTDLLIGGEKGEITEMGGAHQDEALVAKKASAIEAVIDDTADLFVG